ncbi:phenylalanine--tRNA ligase subunit beta [Candidatus Saccharibacteria bacterium]|nr:MAG: phenylalanine--tRNA ligase subunit beta [Candidatus Saccharibacteria bacterium]PID99238.1 MAG: phenylalanine--tRNA ligase subunit beta [Candidatus Saccharibacteria bacterium]
MKVSLNTVQNLVGFDLPPVDELVARINAQLGGVEEIIDLGARYKDAVIVRVVKCEKHPDADKLTVCQIDAGSGELVQVVCGAPNVHADMWAVWLPPGSVVPSTCDDEQPFKLDARKLRGVTSHGMLAAGDELALNSDHEGIVELTESDLPHGKQLAAGASFAETFGLDDIIIDIENKMFTHRPDCFGQLGVAREISAILKALPAEEENPADARFENPEWYWMMPEFASAQNLQLETFNDAKEHVPRLMLVAMENVTIQQSPMWLQVELVRWGSKAINNIVDITNYVMLLTAQPTHAYDYDKLRGGRVGARMAAAGEKLTLLNGKQYELDEHDIVIADGEGPIGLAGIMGGGNSEVSLETKNIVLEVATFDMYSVRRSAMKHGLFTDALTRFNKGQSPLQNARVLRLLMQLAGDVSGAQQASDVHDVSDTDWNREVSLSGEIAVSTAFINNRLGLSLTTEQIGNLLRRANFASYPAEKDEATLVITAPFWRTDIVLPEDIVEEVGRLSGFDKLPRELPQRSTKPAPKNSLRTTKQKIRESMEKYGANEVLTYSFVHENVITRAGQDPAQAFRLSNALSPDLQYYRLSVLPSLLDKVHMNIKAGHDEFVLYEIGKGHNKAQFDQDGLPCENDALACVYAAKKTATGAAYFRARRLVEHLFNAHGIQQFGFEPLAGVDLSSNPWLEQAAAPFDPKRSAVLRVFNDESGQTSSRVWGVVGEYLPSVIRRFKLPAYAAGFEIDPHVFDGAPGKAYVPLSRFPHVTQDISLKVPLSTSYEAVLRAAEQSLATYRSDDLRLALSPLGIYQAEGADTKTVTLRLRATDYERTLTDEAVSGYLDAIATAATEQLGAERT